MKYINRFVGTFVAVVTVAAIISAALLFMYGVGKLFEAHHYVFGTLAMLVAISAALSLAGDDDGGYY